MYAVRHHDYLVQIDLNDLFYESTGTRLNEMNYADDDSGFKITDAVGDSNESGHDNRFSWWRRSMGGMEENLLTSDINQSESTDISEGRDQNPFGIEPGYLERAWRLFCNIQPWSHCWLTRKDGSSYLGFSSAIQKRDLIGGRVWLSNKVTNWMNTSRTDNKNLEWNGTNRSIEVGDKITFGKWFAAYNNLTFWTYRDGDGNEKVKPPGVSRVPMKNDDGTILRDEVGNAYGSPTVPTAEDNYLSNPAHFGSGWSASGNTYVGVAATTLSLIHI